MPFSQKVNCIVIAYMVYFQVYVKGCLLKMNVIKNFFKNHMYSMMIVLILALLLKLLRDFNIILTFLLLFIAYMVLVFGVEYVLSILEDRKSTGVNSNVNEAQESEKEPKRTNTLYGAKRDRQSVSTADIHTTSSYTAPSSKEEPKAASRTYSSMPSATSTYTSTKSYSIPKFEDKEDIKPKKDDFSSAIESHKTMPPAPGPGYDEKTADSIRNIYDKNKARNLAERNNRTPESVTVEPVKTAEESGIYKENETATPDEIDEFSVNLSLEIDKRISESRDSRPVRRRRVFGEIPEESKASVASNPAPEKIQNPTQQTVRNISTYNTEESEPADQYIPAPIDDDAAPAIIEEQSPPSDYSQPYKPSMYNTARPNRFVRKKYDDQVHNNPANLDKLFGKSSEEASDDVSKKKITKKLRKYNKPSVELLTQAKAGKGVDLDALEQEQNQRAKKLVDTLSSFGVGAKIVGVMRGPAVTRYELQPNPGVKVSKIVSLSDDIALNLAAAGVRMEAPIPGKEAVGIEVPNKTVEMVYLRDVIDSKDFNDSKSNLTFAIGKDIAGKNIIADIGKMPHLLIAGATGSGKSVCINTIIASLLYKSGPDDVKLILIDPKIVELGVYNGIPHLLVPVVTDPRKAAGALAWAVGEMEQRYTAFSHHGVRDLNSYNELAKRDRTITHMPQIVIIIDELADLMMTAAKEIEESIIRLAQKARAAGVHLIIATQRPSVDVITGLIKANIPSRIAFAVTSQVDSRTILDGGGAEKLLGRGDMLFHPIGKQKPLRVQGAFVSDGEIEKLVTFVKESWGEVSYDDEIEKSIEQEANRKKAGANGHGASSDSMDDDMDEGVDADSDLIEQAAQIAFEYNQISASFLQRKLRLGYSRASRIIDTLEERGLISSADGSKPRRIIMTQEEWAASNR